MRISVIVSDNQVINIITPVIFLVLVIENKLATLVKWSFLQSILTLFLLCPLYMYH